MMKDEFHSSIDEVYFLKNKKSYSIYFPPKNKLPDEGRCCSFLSAYKIKQMTINKNS